MRSPLICLLLLGLPVGCLAAPLADGLTPVPERAEAIHVPPQPLPDGVEDTGLNVLLDQSHAYTFKWAWRIQSLLRNAGHEVTTSMACLHTVLTPGRPVRIRTVDEKDDKHRPFGFGPAPRYHVVVTQQSQIAQRYLPEEIDALQRFVEAGNGLVMVGGLPRADSLGGYSMNDLAQAFGARFSLAKAGPPVKLHGDILSEHALPGDEVKGPWTTVQLDEPWQPIITAEADVPLVASRTYGAGRVCIVGDSAIADWGSQPNRPGRTQPSPHVMPVLASWAGANSGAAPGPRDTYWSVGGVGGGIYPEVEEIFHGVPIQYASNQDPELLTGLKQKLPEVQAILDRMIPSPPPARGETTVILASGGGGGWAVNIYRPKEVGIISRKLDGVISVLAHEIAHTMTGPPASDGSTGGNTSGRWFEAHAGYFQRRVLIEMGLRPPDTYTSFSLLRKEDPKLRTFDLAAAPESERKNQSIAWNKLWWIYHEFEKRYGENWYPRYMRRRHEMFKDRPGERMDINDIIEAMSRGVGEDLYGFFAELGTTVSPRDLGLPKAAPPPADPLAEP